jgi:hypothetical protein
MGYKYTVSEGLQKYKIRDYVGFICFYLEGFLNNNYENIGIFVKPLRGIKFFVGRHFYKS